MITHFKTQASVTWVLSDETPLPVISLRDRMVLSRPERRIQADPIRDSAGSTVAVCESTSVRRYPDTCSMLAVAAVDVRVNAASLRSPPVHGGPNEAGHLDHGSRTSSLPAV